MLAKIIRTSKDIRASNLKIIQLYPTFLWYYPWSLKAIFFIWRCGIFKLHKKKLSWYPITCLFRKSICQGRPNCDSNSKSCHAVSGRQVGIDDQPAWSVWQRLMCCQWLWSLSAFWIKKKKKSQCSLHAILLRFCFKFLVHCWWGNTKLKTI